MLARALLNVKPFVRSERVVQSHQRTPMAQPNENGERLIWLEERWLDKLNSIWRSGERHSDVILRVSSRDRIV
jgi:hypothetical protein